MLGNQQQRLLRGLRFGGGVRGILICCSGGLSLTFDLRSVAIQRSLGTPPR
jgi:hypothetical protein